VRRRRTAAGPLAVLLVLVGLFATGLGLGLGTGPLSFDGVTGWFAGLADLTDEPANASGPLEPSPPTRIRIPALKVRADVHRVGRAADGTIAVPPLSRHDEAGWYERGPTPGQAGPAVIVGHVDSRDGPAVFHDLRQLRRGDRIEVTRRDRRVAVFAVASVERVDKDRFPADRVHGDFRRPGLRLITCGGRWLGQGRGYADNVIVYATLVETRRA
jgi:hypothetical protein